MYLTGFADEAAQSIEGQIRATRLLGWNNIEARGVDGVNIHDMPDAEFDTVCGKLGDAGIAVNFFGSAIANWASNLLDPAARVMEQSVRARDRMLRLGTRMVRIMSFPVLAGRGPDDQMEKERFVRLREICAVFLDAGILPVHENCMCYGGMSPRYALRMLENVPGLQLVYDTGNPVFTPDYDKPEPRPMQSSWDFYRKVRDHIAYVHIKDGVWDLAAGKTDYMFPGEGDGDVKRIVTDLLSRGYDGGFSMEPHMKAVHHDVGGQRSPEEASIDNYVEYGRRFESLLKGCRSH